MKQLNLLLVASLAACATLLVGSCASHSQAAAHAASSPALVITGTSVVDLVSGVASPASVVVEDGRITYVGPRDQVTVPQGAEHIDAAGTYAIPGLWDMHAHTTHANAREVEGIFFSALVAHGVVAIRDPASRFPIEQIQRWRMAIDRGTLVAPRLMAVGRVIDARPTTIGTVRVKDEREARRAVERLANAYDFIKPYNDLTSAAYLALVAEAQRRNLPVAGHLPYAIDAGVAAAAGQRSIEHLTNLWFETATSEDDIRARIIAGVTKGESPVDLFRTKIDSLFPLALRTYDADRERALLEVFVQHGTWQTPTLVVDRRYLQCGPDAAAASAAGSTAQRFIPTWLRESGRPLDAFLTALSLEQCATLAALYRREADLVGRMQRAGVGLLAGTDAPQAFLAPGVSLHDELEALVSDAGLTPLEALRAATTNPARYFEVSDSMGAVRAGHAADVVLLEANPAVDIRHVRRIKAVVLRGRLLDRRALDDLLQTAEGAGIR